MKFGFRSWILALFAGVALLGCTTTPIPQPATSPRPTAAPTRTEVADSLDGAVLVVATSGHFSGPDERTTFMPARLTVWDNGLLTADVALLFDPPQYRALQLTDDEFAALRQRLLEAGLTNYIAPDVAGRSSCMDCNVQIIRTDVSGVLVEVATGSVPGPHYPENVNLLVREVAFLLSRLVAGDGDLWPGDPPLVPVSSPEAGG